MITITEYTDPACPFAWSAEPSRRRLQWLYGDQLEWRLCMVGLSEHPSPEGFTPEMQAKGLDRLARAHGMPMDTRERDHVAASWPACRAVVAARLNAPENERSLLRAIRVRHFAGESLDAPETLDGAARDAGIDPAELQGWTAEPATQQAFADDLAAARAPAPEAVALAHKLARNGDGYRYTCPSYELYGHEHHLSVPGLQPTGAYEMAVANLAPELTRRENPQSVEEVLGWAGEPLASAEVAEVCGLDRDQAREQLARVATERPVGYDGFWSLAD